MDRTAQQTSPGQAQPGGATAGMPQRAGPYRLLDRIGEGGMGVVHLAADADGGLVAVKLLRPWVVGGQDGRTRLAREVSSMRRVRGPGIAEVLDYDIDADIPYIVTRYVPAPSLDTVVREHGPLQPATLRNVASGLLRALAAVHASGVVHRDVKPGNVLVLRGQPVLIDFGLARAVEDSPLTSTGLVLGTPGFMAPEVIYGQVPTWATDVHGWAATVAFGGTGRHPFGTGPDAVVLDRIRRGEVDLGGLDPALAPLVTRAIEVDPSKRPSIEELLAAVEPHHPVTGAINGSGNGSGSGSGNGSVNGSADRAAPGVASTNGHTPLRADASTPGPGPAQYPRAVIPPPVSAPVPAASSHSPSASLALNGALAATSAASVAPATKIEAASPVPPARATPAVQHATFFPQPPSSPPRNNAVGPLSAQVNPVWVAPAQVATPDPLAAGSPDVAGSARMPGLALATALIGLSAAAAMLAPWVCLLMIGVGLWVARLVWRVHATTVERRLLRGRRSGDSLRTIVRIPWQLVTSGLRSIAQLVVVASCAATVFVFADVLMTQGRDLALAAAGATAALTAWRGPGTVRVRRGATLATKRFSSPKAKWWAAGLTVACAWLLLMAVESLGVQWWPGSSAPGWF